MISLLNEYIDEIRESMTDIYGEKYFAYGDLQGPPENLNASEYPEEGILLNYTGTIMCGYKEHKGMPYIDMGFKPPWIYEEVKSFSFENGRLIWCKDHSAEVKKLREMYSPEELELKYLHSDDSDKYVDICFSLDYQMRIGWLMDAE